MGAYKRSMYWWEWWVSNEVIFLEKLRFEFRSLACERVWPAKEGKAV